MNRTDGMGPYPDAAEVGVGLLGCLETLLIRFLDHRCNGQRRLQDADWSRARLGRPFMAAGHRS